MDPGSERLAGSSRRVPGSGQHRALAHSCGRVSDVFSLDQLASTDDSSNANDEVTVLVTDASKASALNDEDVCSSG